MFGLPHLFICPGTLYQFVGIFSHKKRKGVFRDLYAAFEIRDECCRRGIFHLCLLVDEFRCKSAFEPQTSFLNTLLAVDQGAAHDGQLAVEGNQCEIGCRSLGDECHAHGSFVFH